MQQDSYEQSASYDENTVHTDEARRQEEADDFGRELVAFVSEWGGGVLMLALVAAVEGKRMTRDVEHSIAEFAERWGWKAALRIIASVL